MEIVNENQPDKQPNHFLAEQIALVGGVPFANLPKDFYIPPHALRVILSSFEGPLDLLLYLIRRHNIDILDIPIAKIAEQYASYIEIMDALSLDIIADYLVMAAMLAEIKSKMLLPRAKAEDGEEEDPRAELVKRLQEYEQFKNAATKLEAFPREERDVFGSSVKTYDLSLSQPEVDVSLEDLIKAFESVLKRVAVNAHHLVKKEPLSVRERMVRILAVVENHEFVSFESCFDTAEGRPGVIVTFMALLELLKQHMIYLTQNKAFAPIYIKRVSDE
jgi:segregation and condensation protein A